MNLLNFSPPIKRSFLFANMESSSQILWFDELIPHEYRQSLDELQWWLEFELVPVLDDAYEKGNFPVQLLASLKQIKLLEKYWNLLEKRDIVALAFISLLLGKYDANFATFLTIVQGSNFTNYFNLERLQWYVLILVERKTNERGFYLPWPHWIQLEQWD